MFIKSVKSTSKVEINSFSARIPIGNGNNTQMVDHQLVSIVSLSLLDRGFISMWQERCAYIQLTDRQTINPKTFIFKESLPAAIKAVTGSTMDHSFLPVNVPRAKTTSFLSNIDTLLDPVDVKSFIAFCFLY